MIDNNDKDKLVLQQAVRWFAWLNEHKVNPESMDVFQRWCTANEAHRRAYEKVKQLWESYDGIDVFDLPWPTEEELRFDTYDGSYALPLPQHQNPLRDNVPAHSINSSAADRYQDANNFVLGTAEKPSRRSRFGSFKRIAIAACAAAAVLSTALPIMNSYFNSPNVYASTVGEINSFTLADGSRVTVGASSQVSVNFTKQQRSVILERGEAFFEVAKDASRPFVVSAGNGFVEAVGTAFNVNRREQSVTVSVVEGVVKVSKHSTPVSSDLTEKHTEPAVLEHGQQFVFDRTGTVWQPLDDSLSLERATAWRDGRLAYVNERFASVVQDVNRYAEHKLVIADQVLAELTYTGTVFSANISDWVDGLPKAFPIKVIKTDKQIILLKS